MSIERPLVSIVIPVFNGGDFLHQAIDSALAQTYKNIEILVVNDGSCDNGTTERIALSYGDRIAYHKKPNGGVASALNFAIGKMSGDFFSWLSHDDLYLPGKIERQVDALLSMDKLRTVLYGDFSTFSVDPESAVPIIMRGVPSEDFRYWLTFESSIHGCTLLIPRVALVESGGFNEKLRTTQDYDLWFRLAKSYNFAYLPGCFVKARIHPEQGSVKMSALAQAECDALHAAFVADLTDDELQRSSKAHKVVAYTQLATRMWYRGFREAGKVAIRYAISSFPESGFSEKLRAVGIFMKAMFVFVINKPIRIIRSYFPRFFRTFISNVFGLRKL